jgi:hypothetical protein
MKYPVVMDDRIFVISLILIGLISLTGVIIMPFIVGFYGVKYGIS